MFARVLKLGRTAVIEIVEVGGEGELRRGRTAAIDTVEVCGEGKLRRGRAPARGPRGVEVGGSRLGREKELWLWRDERVSGFIVAPIDLSA
ncbi:hypothetical protein Droror1_Dr00010091 [Drosera rotundifolia]